MQNLPTIAIKNTIKTNLHTNMDRVEPTMQSPTSQNTSEQQQKQQQTIPTSSSSSLSLSTTPSLSTATAKSPTNNPVLPNSSIDSKEKHQQQSATRNGAMKNSSNSIANSAAFERIRPKETAIQPSTSVRSGTGSGIIQQRQHLNTPSNGVSKANGLNYKNNNPNANVSSLSDSMVSIDGHATSTSSGCLSRTNIYIKGLHPGTTDFDLFNMCNYYGTISSIKAITDPQSGKCKGYGFVDFESPAAAEKAVKCLTQGGAQVQMARIRPMITGSHQNNNQHNRNHHNNINYSNHSNKNEADPTNLYIANLPPNTSQEELESLLSSYGTVVSTRILRDEGNNPRGVGFARMETKEMCEQIIKNLSGTPYKDSKEPLLVKFADGAKHRRHNQYHHNNHHHHHHHNQHQHQNQHHSHLQPQQQALSQQQHSSSQPQPQLAHQPSQQPTQQKTQQPQQQQQQQQQQQPQPTQQSQQLQQQDQPRPHQQQQQLPDVHHVNVTESNTVPMFDLSGNMTNSNHMTEPMMAQMSYTRAPHGFQPMAAAYAPMGAPTSATQWIHPAQAGQHYVIPQQMLQSGALGPSSQTALHYAPLTQLTAQLQGLQLAHPAQVGAYMPQQQWQPPTWARPPMPPPS